MKLPERIKYDTIYSGGYLPEVEVFTKKPSTISIQHSTTVIKCFDIPGLCNSQRAMRLYVSFSSNGLCNWIRSFWDHSKKKTESFFGFGIQFFGEFKWISKIFQIPKIPSVYVLGQRVYGTLGYNIDLSDPSKSCKTLNILFTPSWLATQRQNIINFVNVNGFQYNFTNHTFSGLYSPLVTIIKNNVPKLTGPIFVFYDLIKIKKD